MGYIALIIIAITEAMDCFAVSISTGLSKSRIPYSRALLQSFSFGFFQGGMTLLGYFLGKFTEQWFSAIGTPIACGILSILGLRMIWGAVKGDDEAETSQAADQSGTASQASDQKASITSATNQNQSILSILLLSLATSIDAFAVGVSFAFCNVDMVFATAAIAIASFLIGQLGFEIGKRTAKRFKTKIPEIIAGCILIAIGVKILIV